MNGTTNTEQLYIYSALPFLRPTLRPYFTLVDLWSTLYKMSLQMSQGITFYIVFVCLMVFNTTFNNISVISWRSVLLVKEIGVPGENHRPVASR